MNITNIYNTLPLTNETVFPCKECEGACCTSDTPFTSKELNLVKRSVGRKRFNKLFKLIPHRFNTPIHQVYEVKRRHVPKEYGKCAFYDIERFQCSIYTIRPKICKVYGTREGIRCPFGGMETLPPPEDAISIFQKVELENKEVTFRHMSNMLGVSIHE